MLAALFTFAIFSCKKEKDGKTITQTINVTLNINKSYSYQITNKGDADDEMQITNQASNYKVSQLTNVAGSDNVLFEYTPAPNFTGSDEVQVSNAENHQCNSNGQMRGNCGGGGGGNHPPHDCYIYIFKITVIGSATNTYKNK